MVLTRDVLPEFPVTLMNYGKALIIKLDDDGIRFVTLGFIGLVDQDFQRNATEDVLCDSPDDTPGVVKLALDTEVQSVKDKIIWCKSSQAWEIQYHNSSGEQLTADKDSDGNAFEVPEGLEPKEFRRAKFEAKRRAMDVWNILDQSKRHRLKRSPVELRLRLHSSSESQELESS